VIKTRLGGTLHSASADLSDVGANKPVAGMAFDEMRRPWTERTLNTLGLKTSLGRSTRTGSRSSPRVSAHLAIIPVLGPRTEPFSCGSPAMGIVKLLRVSELGFHL
jgi:hypothetical protein